MNLVLLPVLLPLLTGLALLVVSRPSRTRRGVVAGSALLQLVVALALVVHLRDGGWLVMMSGGWAAPHGIAITADLLAALMVSLSAFTSLACLLYGYFELPASEEHPLRLPLVQFLLTGINLAFLTGDLFNLFVAFEVMLVASYALLTLEADNWDIKQAFPYIAVNLTGSTLFLCAAGLAYSLFGTLNLAHIAERATALEGDPRLVALALLLLGIFALKAGLFPLYLWLPGSYPVLPTPLAALFAGLLTKVGIFVILRLVATVLPPGLDQVHRVLAVLAAVTMVLGVLGAISRNFLRGILSFHILSQVGFMVLAIGLFTPLSIAAAILYLVHHIVVKSSLFLVGGVVSVLNRSDDLDRTGNLWNAAPGLAMLFLLQALSLAGLPPLSGFWGKYLIVVAGFGLHQWLLAGVALMAGLLTLFSMLKIWIAGFWRQDDHVPVAVGDARWRPRSWVIGGMTLVSLSLGLGVEGLFRLARQASETALDRPGYIRAVQNASGRPLTP